MEIQTIPPYKLVTVIGRRSKYVEDFDCSKIMLGDDYFKLVLLDNSIRQFCYRYYKIIRNYDMPAKTVVINEPCNVCEKVENGPEWHFEEHSCSNCHWCVNWNDSQASLFVCAMCKDTSNWTSKEVGNE